MSGTVDKITITGRGAMGIDGRNLNIQTIKVENNSSNNYYFHVEEKIEAILRKSGNIFYSGDPEEVILLERESSGNLIHKDEF